MSPEIIAGTVSAGDMRMISTSRPHSWNSLHSRAASKASDVTLNAELEILILVLDS